MPACSRTFCILRIVEKFPFTTPSFCSIRWRVANPTPAARASEVMWRDERIIVELAMSERAGPLPKISAARSELRAFIGGSDARIIMGEDETALVRLWKEKRG